jgi:hypothetical protein
MTIVEINNCLNLTKTPMTMPINTSLIRAAPTEHIRYHSFPHGIATNPSS